MRIVLIFISLVLVFCVGAIAQTEPESSQKRQSEKYLTAPILVSDSVIMFQDSLFMVDVNVDTIFILDFDIYASPVSHAVFEKLCGLIRERWNEPLSVWVQIYLDPESCGPARITKVMP